MITIAIDVGIRGALASLDEDGEIVVVGDLPVTVRGSQKWINGGKLLRMLFAAKRGKPARVFVEYMHALPRMEEGEGGHDTRGGSLYTASVKGLVLGSIVSILEVAELPFELIVPQKWKRAMGLMRPQATYQERKQASLDMARSLFPRAPLQLQKHDGRAEALLIAEYGRRKAAEQFDFVGGDKAA